MDMCDDGMWEYMGAYIEELEDRIAELQGPILTAMLADDRADAWLMRRLTNGHGKPGICWMHGAAETGDSEIGPDFSDFWSCGHSDCGYGAIARRLT